MTGTIKEIPFGATYSPLIFDEQDWDKDLRLMSEANLDLLRIGDVGTWEHIEAREGEFRLEGLRRFYTLAHRYGVYQMLGTGTCSPPLWLSRKHPDVCLLSNRGERYPLGASYHWACIHHPAYLAACETFITTMARFAVKQPNHFGWQITNEIGFPFNPTRETGDIDLYCYCDHSKRQFRDWLRKKYGDLAALTKAWSWPLTNYAYLDWSEIFPPEALPKTWAGVTRWIDWRLFWQQAFADHVRWQHNLIRKIDSDHPTSVNTFNFKGYDYFGTYTGLDQWKISKETDHIAYDLYVGSGNKLATRPEHTSLFLDHGRSVSHFAKSEFWLAEIESGPIDGWLLGPLRKTDEKDVLTMCFESLGHDGKLLIFMPWREWHNMPLRWGALVDLRSNPTPRYHAAATVGRYVKKNGAFLKAARNPPGEVALLESKTNAIFLRGVGQEQQLFNAQRGAYRAFWEQGYRVDFFTPEQLCFGAANRYRIICLPLLGLCTTEMAQALQAYVEQGGVLVAFARFGTLDERGWYHPEFPLPAVSRTFGLDSIEADTLDGRKISFGGRSFDAWLNRDLLSPSSDTEVLGRFDDGWPAITLSRCGNGHALYFATQADAGFIEADGGLLRLVAETVAGRLGIRPQLTLRYPQQTQREVDGHLLDTPERTEFILTSYLKTGVEVELRYAELRRRASRVNKGVLEQEPLEFSQGDDLVLNLKLELDERETQVVSVYWHCE